MTEAQAAVVRAEGRPDGGRLPVVGLPPHPARDDGGVGLAWVEGGTLLAVTTWGSRTHPRVPRTVRVADGELTLTLGERLPSAQDVGAAPTADGAGPTAVMSADIAGHTTLIEPPEGLDPDGHTRVHLGGLHLDLPPAGTPLAPAVRVRPMPATPPPPLSRLRGGVAPPAGR